MGRSMRLLQRGDRDQPELQHLHEAITTRRTDQVVLRNSRHWTQCPAVVHELVSVTMYSTRWLGKDAISTE